MKMYKLFVVLTYFSLSSFLLYSQVASNTIELNSDWEYTHFSYCDTEDQLIDKLKTATWKRAVVPGDVHLDLQRDGELPDLYYGQNFFSSVWVENEDFVYKTHFKNPLRSLNSKVYLDFDGLDCFSTIWVNGKKLGQTHNMFMTYSFEVTDFLNANENELTIRLASPMKEVYKYEPNAEEILGNLSCSFRVKERLITRKMQMSYGWDNVPRIITTGIFRPVKLRVCELARIDNVWFRTELNKDFSKARAKIAVELKGQQDFKGEIEAILSRGDAIYSKCLKVNNLSSSENAFILEINIPDPELWWPSGLGQQAVYKLKINLSKKGKVEDFYSEKVAFRDVKVVTGPVEKRMVDYKIGNPSDEEVIMDGGNVGSWSKIILDKPELVEVTPMKVYVNGRYVFAKGFNMQPLDVFPANISPEKYKRSVMAVKESGANILRIWGGGIVENPVFYDLCDSLGIMVWQDFFYASGQYPNNEAFLDEIEDETINVVKHLRNRACIVAWCGDNESDMVNYDRGLGQFSNKITHVVQKQVLSIYDPDRYWHPSSPSGGGYPRSSWGGDKRNWGAGFPENDYQYIRGDEARFISEGGAISIPQLNSLRKFIPPEYEWPVDNDYYNMHWGDVPTMRRYFPPVVMENISNYFGTPENIAEYIYLTQVSQANGLTRMIQHFRRNSEECGGVVLWKWADTWPSICYSIMDYNENKKAAWYAVKRAFAPVSLMVDNVEDQLSVWYINDLQEIVNQQVVCQLKKTDGSLIKEWREQLSFKENGAGLAIDLKTTRTEIGNGDYYLKVWIENYPAVKPFYYTAADLINMNIVKGSITPSIKRVDKLNAIITLKADEFTPYILITVANPFIQLSDNSFFMEKGETREIKVSVDSGELWGEFKYNWWNGGNGKLVLDSELLKSVPYKNK